jgi:hypothetical protein
MSIVTFGRRERLKFQALGTIAQWQPHVVPAVYAITYKQEPKTRPKAHTVVYFGEAENLAQQAPVINSDIKQWWEQFGGNRGELFVFMYPMPGSSKYERTHVQHQLVAEYDPQANN